MKRILVATVVLLLMLGLAFGSFPATHNVALGSSTTHALVADANDGTCSDGQTQGCGTSTDGGYTGGDQTNGGYTGGDQTNGGYTGGDQTNGGYTGGDATSQSADNSNAAPTPTP